MMFSDLPHHEGDLLTVPVPGAVLSPNGIYRYLLTRDLLNPMERNAWLRRNAQRDLPNRRALFVMVNPSTADATEDDNTIRRCLDYSYRWGYDHLWVCNLSPYRATDPKQLKRRGRDPAHVIDANLSIVRRAVECADLVVVAWGSHGWYEDRNLMMRQELTGVETWCLGTTADGEPRHPLMLRKDKQLERWPVS